MRVLLSDGTIGETSGIVRAGEMADVEFINDDGETETTCGHVVDILDDGDLFK